MINPITFGADPEFVIVNKNNGNLYFSTSLDLSPPIGADGSGRPFELRPTHDEDVLQLSANIGGLINGMDRSLSRSLKCIGGAYPYDTPLGGHIHVGGLEEYSDVLPYFSFLFSILRTILEPKEDTVRRVATGYGGLAACHSQPWGFEYRAPLSWLSHPEYTIIYLGMAKIAVQAYLQSIPIPDKGPSMRRMRSLIHKVDVPGDCWPSITLLERMFQRKKFPPWNTDMRETWRIDV